uniref:Uncharacterized protein n=1 Tax=Rhizophora mucronata TaxID=61149 RepID=A0A2P2NYN2_RHIMU
MLNWLLQCWGAFKIIEALFFITIQNSDCILQLK